MSPPAIETDGFTVRYGREVAVPELYLAIPRGHRLRVPGTERRRQDLDDRSHRWRALEREDSRDALVLAGVPLGLRFVGVMVTRAVRLDAGPGGVSFVCPDCGSDSLQSALGDGGDPVIVCQACNAEFPDAPLAEG